MRRRALTWVAGVLAGVVLPGGVVAGSQVPQRPQPAENGSQHAIIERLPAPGVRLVMNPDPSAKSLASCVVFPAGTRSEEARELGLAELTRAHVLGQTPGLSSSKAEPMLASRGATLTNLLDRDAASFCVTLPARELPLALWLAARRLSTPIPSNEAIAAAAKSAREAASQALRESPALSGATKLEELAFQGYQKMEAPPLAGALLLDAAAERSAVEFFTRAYRESSAVVTIVGRFEPDEAERLAREQFATIVPRQPRPVPRQAEERSPQKSGRYSFFTHDRAANVELYFGWVAPEVGTKAHDALVLASATLALGDGSRLRKRLVYQNQWATAVEGWVGQSRGPTLFGLRIAMSKRVDLDAVARIVAEEIQKLATLGTTPDELRRAGALLENGFVQRMDSLEERARHLGGLAVAFGEPNPSRTQFERLGDVAPAELTEAVRRYLGPYQGSLVEVYPKDYPIQPSTAPMKRYYLVTSGDTLIGIARAQGVALDALLGANGLGRKTPIFPGQKLVIPPGSKAPPKVVTYAVRKGDTLSGIAKKHRISVEVLTRANRISKKKPIVVGQTLVIPSAPDK